MTLAEFARLHLHSRQVSAAYAYRIGKRAAALQVRSGKEEIEDTLTEPNVNAFLRSLDVCAVTVKSYRSDLLALWRTAADLDLVPYPIARRIFLPVVPQLLVECYDVGEVRLLLAAAGRAVGVYPNAVPKSLYWEAAIRLAWESGFRRGDVWRLKRAAMRPGGAVQIIQHKTGQVAGAMLRASTVAALDAIGGDVPLRWTLDASFFGRHFRKLVLSSGVNRGTFRWLRRSSGSYVEQQQPGSGHKHLGHAGEDVFKKHYDAKLGGSTLPQVPEL